MLRDPVHVSSSQPSADGRSYEDDPGGAPLDAAIPAEGVERGGGGQDDGGNGCCRRPIVVVLEKKHETWDLQNASTDSQKSSDITGNRTEKG